MLFPKAARHVLALISLVVAAGLLGLGAPPAAADEPTAEVVPAPRDDGGRRSAHRAEAPADDAPKHAAVQKKPRRGGINPCMTPDPGFGIYDHWNGSGVSIGQVLLPHQGGISKSGQFDVVIHFHGHEPIRKEFVKTAKGVVLVGIDLGIGSGAYQSAFSSPATFTNLLASV